jgi:hypothetical protein
VIKKADEAVQWQHISKPSTVMAGQVKMQAVQWVAWREVLLQGIGH